MSLNVMRNIEYIFPTPIYSATNVCVDIISNLKKETYYLKDKYKTVRGNTLNVDSSHLTASNIISTYPYYSLLKKELQLHVNNFIDNLGGYSDDVIITNMWFNCSDKGDFNFPHTHGGSIVSGVYYIESKGDSILRLYNSAYMNSNICPTINMAIGTQEIYDIPCKKGNLIMWQSNLLHGNPTQTLEGEKIAVSFNTIFNSNKYTKVTDGL